MIANKTLEILENRFGIQLHEIEIEEVRIGAFLTGIRLSNQSFGVASTYISKETGWQKGQREFGPFTPGNITGQTAGSLFSGDIRSQFLDSLQAATLNALSSRFLSSEYYHIHENRDPFDFLDFPGSKKATVVGAFQSYIRRLKEAGANFKVLELNPDALRPEDIGYYVPAAEAERILPGSDIVIITGSTLANRSLDGLLALIPEHSTVVVTGPTSSLLPDLLFEKKVDIVGATRILDPEKMMQVVSQGGAGYHLFRYCAQKIVVLREGQKPVVQG